MDYVLHILILVAIYGILATSLNLVVGYTGLLSLCQAAFYGLGAYTSALTGIYLNVPFIGGVLMASAVAGGFSIVVSLATSRLRDDFFAIATFGFQFIIWNLFNNWIALTRGPMGVPGVSRPEIFGYALEGPLPYLFLTVIFLLVAQVVSFRIVNSPFGQVLVSIREDESLAEMLGKPLAGFKVKIIAVSAIMAGVAGSVYAHYVTYVSPASFTVMESILILSMVIIGGTGSMRGPLLGAMVLITLPEILRFLGMPSDLAANMRQVLYGGSLVAIALYRPQGLMGTYRFSRRESAS